MEIYSLLLFSCSQCALLLTPYSWDKIATCFRVSHWLRNTWLLFREWFDKVTVSFFSVKDFLLLFSGLIRLFCHLRKLIIRPFLFRECFLIYCYLGTWWFQNVRAANCYWSSPLCDLLGQGWCIGVYELVIWLASYVSRDRYWGIFTFLGLTV